MNRAERRAAKKQTPKKKPIFHNLTKQERLERICQNGITIDDLKKADEWSYKQGYSDGVTSTFRSIYAGLCLALNELYGFGSKRCKDVLSRTDAIVTEQLISYDATEAVWNRMKLRISVDDPFERIQEVEE